MPARLAFDSHRGERVEGGRLLRSTLGAASGSVRSCQWGSVAGPRRAPPPHGEALVRREEHAFLTRIKSPLSSTIFVEGKRSGPTTMWTPRAALPRLLSEPHSDGTATLIDGHLDGWLPDGAVTLD